MLKVMTENKHIQMKDADVREGLQQFSARLSHDLNNLLTPLVAYPDMIALELPEKSESRRLLDALRTSVDGMVKIMARLSDLSGLLLNDKERFNPAQVLNQVLETLWGELDAVGGKFVKDEVSDQYEVTISRDSLERALIEVIRNAIQSLPDQEGGRVTLRLEERDIGSSVLAVDGPVQPGRYVLLEVEDNGCGMATDFQTAAFEPFRSDFHDSRQCGRGLGLSIAYASLCQAGARLMLKSKQEEGTVVTILIPKSFSENHEDADADSLNIVSQVEKTALMKQASRILVVDDEPSIGNLFQLILENYLHEIHVDKASNGAEAVKLFAMEPYDVVVMDLHMPVMDGQTAFLEIEKICKEKQCPMPSVVFCTGYAPRDVVKRAISEGDKHTLLNKPVRSEILVKAVQSRLDAQTL